MAQIGGGGFSHRQEILDMFIFDSLDQVRGLTSRLIDFYNHRRPHYSLGGAPPSESHRPVLIDPKTSV
ncbi:MAG: integrase core domain-containing protein [Pyrinomonadaceae bacterium]